MTASTSTDLKIPADLRPGDGHFGCGPSKVRPEQLAALADAGAAVMGIVGTVLGVIALIGWTVLLSLDASFLDDLEQDLDTNNDFRLD